MMQPNRKTEANMDCQICGRKITGSMSVCFGESIIAHIACMHKAEEKAEHDMKSVIRGEQEQEGGGG